MRQERRKLQRERKEAVNERVAAGLAPVLVEVNAQGKVVGSARSDWLNTLRGQCRRFMNYGKDIRFQSDKSLKGLWQTMAPCYEYTSRGLAYKEFRAEVCSLLKYERVKLFNIYEAGGNKPAHISDKSWSQLVAHWSSDSWRNMQAKMKAARLGVKTVGRSGRGGHAMAEYRLVSGFTSV